MTPFQHTTTIINHIRKQTDVVICMYSGGKDSIVLLDLLAKSFPVVHAVFMYFVKGLEHQQPLLRWAEHFPNVTLHQYPHWMLSHYMKHGHMTFHKVTDDVQIIKAVHIEDHAKRTTGAEWLASGERRADSLKRYMFLGMMKFDSIAEGRKHIYPLSHWKKTNVEHYIKLNRLITPCNYNPKANSNGVDLDLETLLYLKNNYPGDLNKILEIFPFAGKILFEYEHELTTRGQQNPLPPEI